MGVIICIVFVMIICEAHALRDAKKAHESNYVAVVDALSETEIDDSEVERMWIISRIAVAKSLELDDS